MESYYVYEHIRNDNQTVFYVGKGHGNRAWVKHRNKKHDEIANSIGMTVRIVMENLTEEQAYQEEYNLIAEYLEQGYGIDIRGLEGNDTEKFLTNQTFGSRGSIGISNPMYNVSPAERMDAETYERWLSKTHDRLTNQYGSNNPNWHNDTLHNKVKDNPELRIQYYSRPGAQNGRCRKVELYDEDGNYIDTFDYIGECAAYIKAAIHSDSAIDSMRSNLSQRAKKGLTYLGYKCILL